MVGSTKCDDDSQTQQMYLRHNANVAFLTLKVPLGMKVEFFPQKVTQTISIQKRHFFKIKAPRNAMKAVRLSKCI